MPKGNNHLKGLPSLPLLPLIIVFAVVRAWHNQPQPIGQIAYSSVVGLAIGTLCAVVAAHVKRAAPAGKLFAEFLGVAGSLIVLWFAIWAPTSVIFSIMKGG